MKNSRDKIPAIFFRSQGAVYFGLRPGCCAPHEIVATAHMRILADRSEATRPKISDCRLGWGLALLYAG